MAGQLISDPKERAKRAAEKENGILTWLADFVYSTTDVLGRVLVLNPSATLSALTYCPFHEVLFDAGICRTAIFSVCKFNRLEDFYLSFPWRYQRKLQSCNFHNGLFCLS